MKPINLTLPSIDPYPYLKLKALPTYLKCVYLGEFSIIIASHLTDGQEENLMIILKKYREVIGWTMTDIKGLSATIIQHLIHFNEEATLKRELQRRLNPIMQEVVRSESLKLLDNKIIYPIFDSQ